MPVFQALGGEMKTIIPLIGGDKNTSQTQTNTQTQTKGGIESDDDSDLLKPSKRTRVEITEMNVSKSKSRKTSSALFPSINENDTEIVMSTVVLDVSTLSWSSLLGPQGTCNLHVKTADKLLLMSRVL